MDKTAGLLLFFLAGCRVVYDPHRPVEVDLDACVLAEAHPGEPDGWIRGVVQHGIHYWDAVGAYVRLPEEMDSVDRAAAQHLAVDCSADLATSESAGEYNTIYANIVLRSDFFTGEVDKTFQAQALVAHEVGHALGLDHVPDAGAVMRALVGSPSGLTPPDEDEFLRLWPSGSD